jgi:thiol-disulfide isomerase/thioredoxin
LIKDYLLSKRISESCGVKPTFVIYFYQNADECPECLTTSISLNSLREDYEKLKVYAFDYNLDLPVIKALASVYGVEKDLPALVINKKTYYKATTKDVIEKLLPKEIPDTQIATTTSTTTKNK